jgi:AcrR family transcriptional regulator
MTELFARDGATGRPTLRRDTQETRDRLLDATGELLAERGATFGLPEIARRCGVSTATVYRHFDTVHDAFAEFVLRLGEQLAARLRQDSSRARGRRRFDLACERWAKAVEGWGVAATRIRSPEGYLERVRRGDELTRLLHDALGSILTELSELGEIPAVDIDYGVLLWITLFDERVILDLHHAKGWSTRKIARNLGAAVIGGLQSRPARPPQRTRPSSGSPGG